MPRLEDSPGPSRHGGTNVLGWNVQTWMLRARALPGQTLHRYHKLGRKSKITFWVVFALHILMLALVIIITPTRIGHFFNNVALKLRAMGAWGVILLSLFAIVTSHPPLFGFSGSLTLIGFTYGVWPGFLIAFIASMAGSAVAFISVRAFFLGWIKKNDKWEAFGHVMRAKGTPLVLMIRYCPIPWAVANGLFASIESVRLWQFMLATVLIQPRLMIPVFIGSRLTSLASDSPSHDPLRFWLNLFSIGLSSAISVVTGVVIYRLTLEQMRKLDRNGPGLGDGELAAEALEEGALLGEYGDESGEEEAELLTTTSHGQGAESARGLRPDANGKMVRRSSSGDSTAGDLV
ncbi:hypothetical protein IAT38_003521 [Cryptococcus sp. DSM 104549]